MPRSSTGRARGREWLAAACATVLTVGLIPLLTASPASAAPDPCNVTITPSGSDDSITLGQTLDDSLTAANAAGCPGGAVFELGTTDSQFEYQLPKSLEWTVDDTLTITGIGDDTPILFAADDTRLLTIAVAQPTPGQAIYLTRLSMRGGNADHGGAIRANGPNTLTLVLQDMEFLGNSVGSLGAGGAIEARDDTVVAITSRFEGNIADDIGGAIGAGRLDIRGSTFVNNTATYGGGGALANWAGGNGGLVVGPEGGTPSRFVGNTSQYGGAIVVAEPSVTAHIEAQFERNSAPPFNPNWDPQGGAIYAWGSTPVEVAHSTFLDDSVTESTGDGGAIWSDAPLTVTGSTFVGATAPVQGGAIAAMSGVTIDQSYFEGNLSALGGALAVLGGPSNAISNSTFWGNSADDSGSGVYVDAFGLTITGSTFDDSVPNSSSVIATTGAGSVQLAGNILSKDLSSASPCEGSVDDSGGNLVTADCGPITDSNLATGLSAVVSDDSLGLLTPALNQTYPNNTGTTPTIGLEPSSVAINRYTTLCPSSDQRGVSRPQGALCDAGAYEAGPIQSIVPLPTTSGTIGTSYSQSLSATGFGFSAFQWDDSGTTLPPGLTLDATGLISGTPTAAGTFTFTARVVGPVDDSSIAQTITVEGAPTPPNPAPATRASAPREVRAQAGVKSAQVSWLPPTSTGSFPVTSYQAVASPGGETCMVAAPVLQCTITGLTPGTPYTVTARALTGAGWSDPSAPSSAVVPLGPEVQTILITNSRDRAQKSMARIEGTTTGLVGAEVVPYLRIAGQTDFSPGTSTRTVDADGNFVWQRKAKKRFTVYFVSGDVTSNRLVIRPE